MAGAHIGEKMVPDISISEYGAKHSMTPKIEKSPSK